MNGLKFLLLLDRYVHTVAVVVTSNMANIPLFNTNYIFKSTAVNSIFIILAIVVVVKIILDLFLKTKAGFLLTAVGDNEQVVSSLGVNKNLVKVLGLAISNGLVALAGALTAQHQGFADVTMGTGIVVMGLAAVIIGVSIFGKISFIKATTLSIFGAIIYKLVIAIALWMKLNPNDLKILTAVLVAVALAANNNVFKFKRKNRDVKSMSNKGGDGDAKDSRVMQSI